MDYEFLGDIYFEHVFKIINQSERTRHIAETALITEDGMKYYSANSLPKISFL